eukprot:TRINITY_DN779786_c0_g1_i1.p1 TRINITY_DN779786_c0_g1~~TRINITY_DN779786_c0_g1_i1.p1  ORF type:complete len:258 (+),score=69.07 TRINITY_DN779786_c0_g1_i1:85-858(+)
MQIAGSAKVLLDSIFRDVCESSESIAKKYMSEEVAVEFTDDLIDTWKEIFKEDASFPSVVNKETSKPLKAVQPKKKKRKAIKFVDVARRMKPISFRPLKTHTQNQVYIDPFHCCFANASHKQYPGTFENGDGTPTQHLASNGSFQPEECDDIANDTNSFGFGVPTIQATSEVEQKSDNEESEEDMHIDESGAITMEVNEEEYKEDLSGGTTSNLVLGKTGNVQRRTKGVWRFVVRDALCQFNGSQYSFPKIQCEVQF